MHVTSLKIQSCELIFNEKLYVYSFISIKPSFQKLEAEKIGTQTTQISCQHRHTHTQEEETEQSSRSGNTILTKYNFTREILTCARSWIGSSFLCISFVLCIWITRPLHNTTDRIHTDRPYPYSLIFLTVMSCLVLSNPLNKLYWNIISHYNWLPCKQERSLVQSKPSFFKVSYKKKTKR